MNKKHNAQKRLDQHKLWLVLGVAIAVIAVLVLVLYSPTREALFGKATAVQCATNRDACLAGCRSDCTTTDCFDACSSGCLRIYNTCMASVTAPLEDCTNKVDDDGDNRVDCQDKDCASETACLGEIRLCSNNADCLFNICINGVCAESKTCVNDADCGDPHLICKILGCAMRVVEGICNDNVDNDLDALIDCADSDCDADPDCIQAVELCDDNMDNDGDNWIDCADSDCTDDPACAVALPEKICNDGIDNDADKLTDCADPNCAGGTGLGGITCCQNDANCPEGTICQNNNCLPLLRCLDADNDGYVAGPGCTTQTVDCDDTNAAIYPGAAENCVDKVDNDCDGFTNCDDSDCDADPACGYVISTIETICNDGVNNDITYPSLIDCADPNCDGRICNLTGSLCVGGVCKEKYCNDGLDNEGDSLIDCIDPDCQFPDTSGADICWEKTCDEVGIIKVDNDNDGLVNCYDLDCDTDPACVQAVELCNDGLDNDADGLIDCEDKTDCCTDVSCASPSAAGADICWEKTCDEGPNVKTVDNDNDGSTNCADSDCATDPACVQAAGVEICDNRISDDDDKLIDCADSDCYADPVCCPSLDWSNVCCLLTNVQFMNFINAQNKEETGYTDVEFMNFINKQNAEISLC